MAELHIIGQILSACNFEEPNLFCKWSIQFGKFFDKEKKTVFQILFFASADATGSNWKSVEGDCEGTTATCRGRIEPISSFSHPIDLHLACRGIQGWPKIHVEVYAVNALNNCWPVGLVFLETIHYVIRHYIDEQFCFCIALDLLTSQHSLVFIS